MLNRATRLPAQLKRATIEVRIHGIVQIFNSLDPSPFAERDLDDDAEAYLVGWAREVDTGGPFRIIVHLPTAEANKARERDLGSSIGHYFAYRAGMLERDLRDLFRVGWRSLAIGIAVLAVSIGLSQIVRAILPEWAPARLFAEGITIFGWVANWRPAEIFLYDIWAAPTPRLIPASGRRSNRSQHVLRVRGIRDTCGESAANCSFTQHRRFAPDQRYRQGIVLEKAQFARYEVDAMLEIAPEKVAHIIVKAREYDSKVAAWDDTSRSGDAEDDPSSILEDFTNDPTRVELAAFIDRLNVDEQVHLVALAWIGRAFSTEEFDEAVQTARDERINWTSRYLLGMPLLADYLEEGLGLVGNVAILRMGVGVVAWQLKKIKELKGRM